MRVAENTLWVVYQTGSTQRQPGRNAVCTQAEWEEKERANPGLNTLLREGITNEGVAERLARDLQSPPDLPKPARGRTVKPPTLTTPVQESHPPGPPVG